jgi:hypothetical protein
MLSFLDVDQGHASMMQHAWLHPEAKTPDPWVEEVPNVPKYL